MNKPSWMRIGMGVCAGQELINFRDTVKTEASNHAEQRLQSERIRRRAAYMGKKGKVIEMQPFERLAYPSGTSGFFGEI